MALQDFLGVGGVGCMAGWFGFESLYSCAFLEPTFFTEGEDMKLVYLKRCVGDDQQLTICLPVQTVFSQYAWNLPRVLM